MSFCTETLAILEIEKISWTEQVISSCLVQHLWPLDLRPCRIYSVHSYLECNKDLWAWGNIGYDFSQPHWNNCLKIVLTQMVWYLRPLGGNNWKVIFSATILEKTNSHFQTKIILFLRTSNALFQTQRFDFRPLDIRIRNYGFNHRTFRYKWLQRSVFYKRKTQNNPHG